MTKFAASFDIEFVKEVLPDHFRSVNHVGKVEWEFEDELLGEEEPEHEEEVEAKIDEFDEEVEDKKQETVPKKELPLTLEGTDLPHPMWLREFWKLVGFASETFEKLKPYSLIPGTKYYHSRILPNMQSFSNERTKK